MAESLAHRIKQACRSVYEALPIAAARLRHGRPDCILRFDGGIGDELLCTALIREIQARKRSNIWMYTAYPELFRGNPDISFAPKKNVRGIRRFMEIFKLEPFALGYAQHVGGRDIAPLRHVISILCERQGLSGKIAKRPYLYLSPEEKSFGSFGKRQIAIQTSGLSAKYAAYTKEWFPERFQKIVEQYRDRYTFVQIGSPKDPLLEGVVDMRGKTSIRQTAAILGNSLVFVGLAGFLQHLARSVECRSVIIYGGRELPLQTGYGANENITNTPECSPCWIYGRCEHNIKCMDAISVSHVVEAIERQLARLGTPLSVDDEILGVPTPATMQSA